MKFGVVVFPGSNCDEDCYYVVSHVLQQKAVYLWHKDRDLQKCDALILPGGFSYGDYLRTGAIARFAPIMPKVIRFAKHGGLVIGICNGFQILLEAGLLPGAMLRNTGLRFICRHVYVRVEHNESAFTNQYQEDQVLKMPIAHNEGRYAADDETIGQLNSRRQVLLRYCDRAGRVTEAANPNGSADNIAGIVNESGNVFGLMPHPERSSEPELGSADGRGIFASMVQRLVAIR